MIEVVLRELAEKLNSEKITWAVGASVLLLFHGLVDDPNDIDIFVEESDFHPAEAVLSQLGDKKNVTLSNLYSTKYFYKYKVKDVDVDIMAGYIINYGSQQYYFQFSETAIVETKKINGVPIPLTSLEDWYIMYQLMSNRESKVKIIEEYLRKNGVRHPGIFEKALQTDIPSDIKKKLITLLK